MTAGRLAALAGTLGAGCAYPAEPLDLPEVDPVVFRDAVYPVLLASCGHVGCHGDPRRFFTVYGPGRTRLASATGIYDPVTPEELAVSFTRARSMLLSPDGVRRAPLLRKPLAVAAGGAGHRGDDPWGASPFASKADPRFETLFFWATAAEAAPAPRDLHPDGAAPPDLDPHTEPP